MCTALKSQIFFEAVLKRVLNAYLKLDLFKIF